MLNKDIKRFRDSLYVYKDEFILDISNGWKFKKGHIKLEFEYSYIKGLYG